VFSDIPILENTDKTLVMMGYRKHGT